MYTEACMTRNGTCVAARVGKTGTAGIETRTPTDETEVEAKEGTYTPTLTDETEVEAKEG